MAGPRRQLFGAPNRRRGSQARTKRPPHESLDGSSGVLPGPARTLGSLDKLAPSLIDLYTELRGMAYDSRRTNDGEDSTRVLG